MSAKLEYRSKGKAKRSPDVQVDVLAHLTVLAALGYAGSYAAFRSIDVDDWGTFFLAVFLFGCASLSACGACVLGARVVLRSSRGLPLFLLACNALILVISLGWLRNWMLM